MSTADNTSSQSCPQVANEPHPRPQTGQRPLRFTLPLPDDINTNPNLRFYGMAITKPWLCGYARRYLPKEDRDSYNSMTLMNHAISLLQYHTRIQTLTFEIARFEPGVPPDTPADNGAIMVVSICAYTVESYNRRPSQQKVDILSYITGQTPRWWTDYVDAKCYC